MSGVKRLLLIGSSCIYPKYSPQPITEESLLTGPLESTLQYYAIIKLQALRQLKHFVHNIRFDAIALLPSNLYGLEDNYDPTNSHVLPSLIRRFHIAHDSNTSSVSCWGSGMFLESFYTSTI